MLDLMQQWKFYSQTCDRLAYKNINSGFPHSLCFLEILVKKSYWKLAYSCCNLFFLLLLAEQLLTVAGGPVIYFHM